MNAQLATFFSAYGRGSGTHSDAAADRIDLRGKLQKITRDDRRVEARIGELAEKRELSAHAFLREQRDAARLRKRFYDQNAGHHLGFGEMPLEEPLVCRDGFHTLGGYAGRKLVHTVDHQKRFAVRQDTLDLIDSNRFHRSVTSRRA
jgi:hypothetical protein